MRVTPASWYHVKTRIAHPSRRLSTFHRLLYKGCTVKRRTLSCLSGGNASSLLAGWPRLSRCRCVWPCRRRTSFPRLLTPAPHRGGCNIAASLRRFASLFTLKIFLHSCILRGWGHSRHSSANTTSCNQATRDNPASQGYQSTRKACITSDQNRRTLLPSYRSWCLARGSWRCPQSESRWS